MSNPYPDGFLDRIPLTGRVLDCGAGGRTHPRITALEYVPHPRNDVQGSALDLPFRSASFAVVLSQAVLEHVTDPQRAVDEMVRVLEPGGLLWLEVAFMQPVHQAPVHYFNATPFGVAHLCRRLDVEHLGGFGTWAENWDWIGREAGAHEVLTDSERRSVRTAMAKLDAAVTPLRQWNTAPGVRLLGRKP